MRRTRTRARRTSALVSAIEPLETRRLLSTINWVNKGTPVSDTDDFNATYGANANIARVIVQRAIDDWERVITNFNGAFGRNTFDLTIEATGLGGTTALETTSIGYDAAGKPDIATFRLDNDAGGAGWYFDGAPGTSSVPDDSDFTAPLSRFAADRTIGTGHDLYRWAARGVGFAMGLATSSATLTSMETDVGDDPLSSDPAHRLMAVDVDSNGSTDYTLTTAGGRNLFEGGGAYAGPVHPNELLNNSRTLPGTNPRRVLISDDSASLLRDVYDYTVTMPSSINTFYVNLNASLNQVTITGDLDGDLTDVIDLEVAGTAMSFEVNGTDEEIEGAEFATITVNSLEGIDNIDVDEVLSGKTVTVNAGNGNDTVHIAAQFGDIDTNLDSDVSVNGGSGTDTLLFNDTADTAGADTYTITSPQVTKGGRNISHSLFEELEIDGSDQASVWNVDSTSSTYTLELTGGVGAETFNVGDDDYDSRIFGDVTLNAFLGDDVMNIDDLNDAGTGDYTLTGTTFSKTTGGQLTFSSMQSLTLNGSHQPSTYNVTLGFAGMSVTVNAGQGNDTLDLGGAGNDLDASMASPLTFNGQNGNDLLLLDDSGDAAASDSYTVGNNLFDKSSSAEPLTYSGAERITLTANEGSNEIDLRQIGPNMNVTLNGAGGNDTFTNPNGDLNSFIEGNATLNGGNGGDIVSLSDLFDGTATGYTLTDETLQVTAGVLSGTITYEQAEAFGFSMNSNAAEIDIESTHLGTGYVLSGNGGDDVFNVGGTSENLDALLADVSIRGDPGSDSVNLLDANHLALSSYYVRANELFRVGKASVFPSTVESILLSAGDGNNSVHVEGVAAGVPVVVGGNDGHDAAFVGNGNWDANILDQLFVIGGNGTDGITINDTADAGADNYTLDTAIISKANLPGAEVAYAQLELVLLDANTGANVITVQGTSTSARINGNTGVDTFNVIDQAVGTNIEIEAGAGLDILRANTDSLGTASVTLIGPQDFDSIRAFAGALIQTQAGGDKLVYTRTLTVDANGRLDLNDNDMILDYTGLSPITTVSSLVSSARNGGAWTGATGLTSSAAKNAVPQNTTLGVMESNDFKAIYGAAATFAGQAIDNTAVLVKYTYYGDADFNGRINFDDYARIDAGFLNNRTGWLNGDFDGNGAINFDDYALIDQAFLTQGNVVLRPAQRGGGGGGSPMRSR